MDYNRIVKDLNGMSEEEFLLKIKEETPFEIISEAGELGHP